MSKDSFLTVSYRNGHINTCYNRNTKKEEITVLYRGISVDCKSIIGAKRMITKLDNVRLRILGKP